MSVFPSRRELARGWAAFVVRRRRAILASALVLTVAALLWLSRVEFRTDLAELLPEDDPIVHAWVASQERFAADAVLLLEDLEEPIEPELGELLAEIVAERPAFAGANTIPFELPTLDVLLDHALQLVPPERRDLLLERLEPGGMAGAVSDLRLRLSAPGGALFEDLAQRDPLNLLGLLSLERMAGPVGWTIEDGVLVSPDGHALVVFAELAAAGTDESTYGALLADLTRVEDELRAALAEAGEDPARYRLRATGTAVVAAQEAALLRRETLVSFALSLVAVLALFALAFRRWSAAAWLALPLASGVAVTIALGDLVFGGLSFLTAGAAALLVGLGIDFGIHIYTRVLDRSAEGASEEEAVRSALEEVSGANLAAVMTSGLAFGALVWSALPGLREMGLLTALGLGLSFLFMSAVFPALLLTVHARAPERRASQVPGRWLDPWLRRVARHRFVTLATLGALTLAAASFLPWLRFGAGDYSARLRVNPALQVQEEMNERFGSSLRASVVLVSASDAVSLDRAVREVLRALEPLERRRVLNAVVSPLAWLPSPAEQMETLDAIRELSAPPDLAARARVALEASGLRPEAFETGLSHLESAAASSRPLDLPALLALPGVEETMERFFDDGPDGLYGAIYLLPREPRRAAAAHAEIAERIAGAGIEEEVDATLIAPQVLSARLRREAQTEFLPLGLLAAVAVAAVPALHFRRPLWVVLCLAPLAISLVWLLGIVGATSLRLSIENISVMPMIVGIGIDDALHVLHHLKRHPERSMLEALRESGKAVVLTTATTVLAFASLAWAGHPALRSLGALTGLGVTFCLVTTLTLLPCATPLLARRRR